MARERGAMGAAAGFEPIERSVGLADRVAGALTESIVSGRLQPGDRLPTERELCEQFEVSRPVVREAVRSLIAKGLLRDSPRRGHVVSALGREAFTESLTLYLRGRRLDYGKLMEVRDLIEVENAGLAAERASPDQLEALRAAAARLRSGLSAEEGALADVEFHRAIATCTGNEFFGVLLDSIGEVLVTVQLPTLAQPRIVRAAMRAHARILERIEAGDPAGAREAMRGHLREAERGMRSVLRSGAAGTRAR
jgi:GntR family transcriptional regulator, transcriptional repressor for pyruvate dehydrogenase complex